MIYYPLSLKYLYSNMPFIFEVIAIENAISNISTDIIVPYPQLRIIILLSMDTIITNSGFL